MDPARDGAKEPAINPDVIAFRISFRPELGGWLAVDRHSSLKEYLLRFPARREARRGDDLLQPFLHALTGSDQEFGSSFDVASEPGSWVEVTWVSKGEVSSAIAAGVAS